jgi:hypothetical protein
MMKFEIEASTDGAGRVEAVEGPGAECVKEYGESHAIGLFCSLVHVHVPFH